MDQDFISAVKIDDQGRLHVVPDNTEFPLIYHAGLEVSWDDSTRSLHSPKPRDWDYVRWYQQLVTAAAQEYGCQLLLTDQTTWINVDPDTKAQLLEAQCHGA